MSRPDLEEAIKRVRDLPTLPAVVARILSTASDPDASALDLGNQLQGDPSLAATLLKVVNSAYYGLSRQVKSVTQAIVLLGFVEVRNLALAATAFRSFAEPSDTFDRAQLWRHSIAAALAAEQLARQRGLPREGAYEAGLLHDIGKVVFDVIYPDRFRACTMRAHAEARLIGPVLEEDFGMDHAAAGAVLAEHWNLPAGVVQAIRRHVDLDAIKGNGDAHLTWLASVASTVADAAGFEELSSGCPEPEPEAAYEALGVSAEQRAAIEGQLTAYRPKVDAFVSVLQGTA